MRQKRWRKWLEPTGTADSYVLVTSDEEPGYASVDLRIADCERRIGLYFFQSNPLRARQKLRILRAALDEVERRMDTWEGG